MIKKTFIREKNFLSKKEKTKQNKKQKEKTRTDLTLGLMVKAKLYRQNLTQKYTHTHSQKEKRKEKSFSDLPGHGRAKLPKKPKVSLTSVCLFLGEHPKSQVSIC